MKIGILTFHNGINHGAFFQALFLQSYLKALGNDVEIINYKNRMHWRAEYKTFLLTKRPSSLIKNIRKILKFRKDQELFILHSKSLTTRARDLEKVSSEYDYIVVGSDIVWDYEYPFTGNDPVYFGKYLFPKKGLVSYAASMGRSTKKPPRYVVDGLRKFKAVSVRDDNTQNIVKQYARLTPTKVLDPTLLMDLEELKFNRIGENLSVINKNNILLYAYYLPDSWRSRIQEFAANNRLDIIVVGYSHSIDGLDRTDAGPAEWLNLFKKATYVITSTFHGTIFAISNAKPFLTIANNAIEHKAGSLLRDLELYSRYIHGDFDENILIENLDIPAIKSRLENLRATSIEFLKDALGGAA